MAERDWEGRYQEGSVPWDSGVPDPHLVGVVEAGLLSPCRLLEIGSGTGTNSIWLAKRNFDVVGVDLAPTAVERARTKLSGELRCRFEVLDFLKQEVAGAPFDAVFDRGCFHVFDRAEDQARFASRVSALLHPGGRWVSLLGSTEGAPRDTGPPRRNVREITSAIEPVLQIIDLKRVIFDEERHPVEAWLCISAKRQMPAQPSSE